MTSKMGVLPEHILGMGTRVEYIDKDCPAAECVLHFNKR
jgi:hypothetical protein